MSFLSLLPVASAQAARKAVYDAKALAASVVLPGRSEFDARSNGYLDHSPAKPSLLAVVTGWRMDAPCLMALTWHPMDKCQDATAGNARGEALALGISSMGRRALLLKAGCKAGPSYCPSFLAPKGWASGRSDVGLPVGLWSDEGREDAPARRADWKPRPAWDAIEPKPTPSAVWTQEGWRS